MNADELRRRRVEALPQWVIDRLDTCPLTASYVAHFAHGHVEMSRLFELLAHDALAHSDVLLKRLVDAEALRPPSVVLAAAQAVPDVLDVVAHTSVPALTPEQREAWRRMLSGATVVREDVPD